MSSVAVIGTGYVGLTTGAGLAGLGHDVVCMDTDAWKIATLQAGGCPILEDGLGPLVAAGVAAGNLRFTTDERSACSDAEFVVLCVPTPADDDGHADLSFVTAAAASIGPHLRASAVVVTKSTLPVGSVRVVESALDRPEVAVASNPEFLREGCAVADFFHPDRIVIGAEPGVAARVATLYRDIDAPLVVTDPTSAEAAKQACNAFLATKVTFANAVADLCERLGAELDDVLRVLSLDHRIGADMLRPGPGWGGSCLPKDTRALLRVARESGGDFPLLASVIGANTARFEQMADRIAALAPAGGEAAVAVWGLTFKAGTDDLRASPAIEVVARLLDRGFRVTAFDPAVPAGRATDRRELPAQLAVVDDAVAACERADVLAVLSEWEVFRRVDLGRVAAAMRSPAVFDARGVLDHEALEANGFRHRHVGRP